MTESQYGLSTSSLSTPPARAVTGWAALVALVVSAGCAVVLEPRVLLLALAAAAVVVCAKNVKVARMLLTAMLTLLPFHAFLASTGLVAWWKEALLAIL